MAAAEAEAMAIKEAEAAPEVRQIQDVDFHYIRQKHSWCRSAPPIDMQGALTGSPVTFRWVCTNADPYSQAERMTGLSLATLPTSPKLPASTPFDVQGALVGSPVTFRWVRTNADASITALKPSHCQSTTLHGQPHHRHNSNLIANAWMVNAVWITALPTYRESTPLHEFHHCHMSSLITGRPTTSSQTVALSSSSPSLPISNLPAWLAGIGFTMTEALPSISWRPAPPPPTSICKHR